MRHIDLFAGCGGASLGLEKAGFTPAYASELNPDALSTYLANRDAIPHCNDIADLLSKLESGEIIFNDIDLVIGGPPCQGYSGIGHRRSYAVDKQDQPSNHLYQKMADVISIIQPRAFVFENVRGLLSGRWTPEGDKGEIWTDVQRAFDLPNYKVQSKLVYAKDFGVPQNRPRVLLIGVRKDCLINDSVSLIPEPNGVRPPDLWEVLGDLGEDGGYSSDPQTAEQLLYRQLPTGSINRSHVPISLTPMQTVTEQDLPKHKPQTVAKYQSILDNNGVILPEYKTRKFSLRLLPREWENAPNITIASNDADYIHYEQPRTLTVREWARLQGFPDWYTFCGKRTTGGIKRAGNPQAGIYTREAPKYTQIGNAIPVLLAKAIGHHIRTILKPI